MESFISKQFPILVQLSMKELSSLTVMLLLRKGWQKFGFRNGRILNKLTN